LSTRKKIHFAVVGHGHIGSRHAEEISSNEDAVLAAVADISEEALSKAEKFKCQTFPSLEQMLEADLRIDVVNICTPNGLHTMQAEQAIRLGKHVLVEKPLGLRSEDCGKLIALAKEAGKQVFCVLQNRYSAQARFLKDFVEAGKLGDIHWLDIACYWNRDERYYGQASWRGTNELDGGTLFTQFSHFIDLLYWVFGDIEPVTGTFGNFSHEGVIEFEDTGSFHFRTSKGNTAGVFSYSTCVYTENLESTITVIGSKGTIKLGGQYMNSLEYFLVDDEPKPDLPNAATSNDYGTYRGSAANHAFVIQNVIKTLNGEHAEIATGEEAAASVAVIEKVYSLRKL
jgi:UDP-N-acetyl-2-amino-2-deoxyglucuronate dehydrogenase